MISVNYNNEKTKAVAELPLETIYNTTSFEGKWVHLINPDDKEISFVSSVTGISEDFLKAPLDEEERPRIDKEDDSLLILVDIPVIDESDDDDYYTYSTLPMGIVIRGKNIVTVCLKDSIVVRDIQYGRIRNVDFSYITRFTFQLLYSVSMQFQHYLRRIDKASQKLQDELQKHMKNEEIIQLLDIENSLVYFSTSLRLNCSVIDKLTRQNHLYKYEEDQDLIEDVGIESLQAYEMCNTYRDILSGTRDAFSSVISNNLNNRMKTLTSITVILAVPTMVAGLFGMNIDGIPGNSAYSGGKWWVFLLVCGVTLLLTGIIALIMWKRKIL